jgi:hypothetical protein
VPYAGEIVATYAGAEAAGGTLQVTILPLTVLNLAMYGKIEQIPGTVSSTINTAVNSLFHGPPASIAGNLKYDVSVVQAFVARLPMAAANVASGLVISTTEWVQKKSPTDGATSLKSRETPPMSHGL